MQPPTVGAWVQPLGKTSFNSYVMKATSSHQVKIKKRNKIHYNLIGGILNVMVGGKLDHLSTSFAWNLGISPNSSVV